MSNLVLTRNGKIGNRRRGSYNQFPNFDGLLNELFTDDMSDALRSNYNKGITLPKVNIQEIEDAFKVDMAVPGLNKSDFSVRVDKDTLVISAEIKDREDKKENQFTRREFGYASFQRTFILPETVDGEKIEAKYKEGILSVELPKKEEAKPKPARAIEIG